jgi:hypothetical protein
MTAETVTVTTPLPKVEATVAFLKLCEAKGWDQVAADTTADMPEESFRWLCMPSGWRAKDVDVRAFFEETTRFELRGRAKDVDRIATALRRV